jgi:hypothetical protein
MQLNNDPQCSSDFLGKGDLNKLLSRRCDIWWPLCKQFYKKNIFRTIIELDIY